MKIPSKGIIYIVTRSLKILEECIFSASTAKKMMPDLPLTLFTDLHLPDSQKKYFDKIIKVNADKHPLKTKVNCLPDSPYDYTLFVDADTQFTAPVYELFDFLYWYDFGISRALKYDWSDPSNVKFVDFIDDKYCNTGVFIFNKSKGANLFITKWMELVNAQDESVMKPGFNDDQHYFNLLNEGLKYPETCGMKLFYFPNKVYNVTLLEIGIKKLREIDELKYAKILHDHNLSRQRFFPKAVDKMKSMVKGKKK